MDQKTEPFFLISQNLKQKKFDLGADSLGNRRTETESIILSLYLPQK